MMMFFLISFMVAVSSCGDSAANQNSVQQKTTTTDDGAAEEIYKDVVFRKATGGKHGDVIRVMFADGSDYYVFPSSSRRIYLESGDTIFYKMQNEQMIEIVRICWKK